MNLGHAVAVSLYELTSRVTKLSSPASDEAASAPSGDLDLLAKVIEDTMQLAGYSPRTMQAANRHDLRLLLRRLAPGKRDARRILGLFRRILWRLEHGMGGTTKDKSVEPGGKPK